jgi:CoA:oxalate CoA-transferase
MLDCQIALLENSIVRYTANQEIPGPIGNRHPSVTPFEMFPTSNGNIIVCIGNQQNWEVFCDVLKDERLTETGRFDTNDLRTDKHDELHEVIADILTKKTTDEWDKIFYDAGIACGTVNNVRDVVENEQVAARNMIVSTEYPDLGVVRAPGSPIKSREYSVDTSRISPALGGNNEEVYSSLGISEEKRNELKKKKVI